MVEKNLLDPALLSQIEGLALQAKIVSQGVLAGMHVSNRRGVNVEFADHKEYSPGDDLRYLDWRVFARRDTFSIKKFEEERSIHGYLGIDVSRSMRYRGGFVQDQEKQNSRGSGFSKLDYARVLAGSLAYLLVQQRDGVGIIALAKGQEKFIPARADSKHLNQVLIEIEKMTADDPGDFSSSLAFVTHHLRMRSMVIFFTDLLGNWANTLSMLKGLRALKHDVCVFHLLDRYEVDFPFSEAMEFQDLEGGSLVVADAPAIRKTYRSEINHYLAEVRQTCLQSDIRYVFARTDQPLNEPLQAFLRG